MTVEASNGMTEMNIPTLGPDGRPVETFWVHFSGEEWDTEKPARYWEYQDYVRADIHAAVCAERDALGGLVRKWKRKYWGERATSLARMRRARAAEKIARALRRTEGA